MSCNDFHLVKGSTTCYQIQQGATLNWITFLYPSDLTAWVPTGQLRRNYADLDQSILAQFSFDPLVYGPQTINGVTANYTSIRPILTAAQTALLPPTKQGIVLIDGDTITVGGKNAKAGTDLWVYDVEIASSLSTVIKVARGLVQVIQEVTRA